MNEPRDPGRRLRCLAILLLLTVHAVLVMHCAVGDFATYDETGNLCGGIAIWEKGSYRLYNVNPPLPRMLAALPVLAADPVTSAIRVPSAPRDRPEWGVGDHFARDNAPRFQTLLVLGRSVGVLWSLLGALGVYCWAKALWGPASGLLALTVWCFEPNIIGLAHLINSDVPGTVAGLWAAYAFRHYVLVPSWWAALLAGLALGVALSCKFTLLILCPLWLCYFFVRGVEQTFLFAEPWRTRMSALLNQVGHFALLVAACLYVINMNYEFSGTGTRLEDYPFVSESLAGPRQEWRNRDFGNRFAGTWLGKLPVPLPDDFLRGIDVQRLDFEASGARPKYLHGEWHAQGQWYYYLYGAAIKVPLGVWGLLIVSLACGLLPGSEGRLPWREFLLLAVPGLAIAVFVSSQITLLHFRYVVPAFPFAIIYAGGAGRAFALAPRRTDLNSPDKTPAPEPMAKRGRVAPALVLGLLLWSVGSYLWFHPHSLAYFNELVGGPEGGFEHLISGGVDWGQDLHRLKRWIDEHPEARPLQVAYFNHMDTRIAGVSYDLPPLGVSERNPSTAATARAMGPQPGYFAVSVAFVRGHQQYAPNGQGGYRLNPLMSLSYFQHFRPIAKAGYTIFIYHVTLEEANEVRARYGLPPLNGIR